MSIDRALAPWPPQALRVLRFLAGLEILRHGEEKAFSTQGLICQRLDRLAGVGWRGDRTGRRRADGDRPVHAADSLHPLRLHGGGLLHGPRRQKLLSDPERWRTRSALLLRIPVHLRRRSRPVERRRRARQSLTAQGLIKKITVKAAPMATTTARTILSGSIFAQPTP